MTANRQEPPRVGVVGLAYGGYNLGEELGPGKMREMCASLARVSVEVLAADRFVLKESDAAEAGRQLAAQKVDCILAVLTTFVPDYYIVELLRHADVPVFIWAVEREMQCISVVAGPLITATLFNLKKHYRLAGADIGDKDTLAQVVMFARAAMLRRLLRTARIGYCGGRCPIMLNMAADKGALQRILGATVIPFPLKALQDQARAVSATDARTAWKGIRREVGQVTVPDDEGMASSRYYLAARRLVAKHRLDALSINCFPHLKSRVCLAVARLNDDGIAAACEGDLHSTILMHLLGRLMGRASFNGDWLRMYPATNEVLFSHCGAGAFSLAGTRKKVCLRCSIETRDGLAVCYATAFRGPVTLANLMMGAGDLRLAVLRGRARKTDLQYEGTPLKVHFQDSPNILLQRIARCGAGHHWNGVPGDFAGELELLCAWLGVKFNDLGIGD